MKIIVCSVAPSSFSSLSSTSSFGERTGKTGGIFRRRLAVCLAFNCTCNAHTHNSINFSIQESDYSTLTSDLFELFQCHQLVVGNSERFMTRSKHQVKVHSSQCSQQLLHTVIFNAHIHLAFPQKHNILLNLWCHNEKLYLY